MLSVGPVPLPVVLALIFLLLAMGVVRVWPRPASLSWRPANALLLDMFLLGLVGARVLFVLRNVTAYLASPWSVLRIGDGGFDPLGFFIAAAAWALWRLRKTPAVRAPVLAAALLGSSGWLLASFGLQHLQAQRVQVPAVVLQDLAGAPVRLADTQGQPLVLNLWASWCGPCVREMPVLSAAQRRHPQVRFVFVNQGEDAETVQRFLLQHAPALQGVLLDVSSTTGDALGVQAYPSTLFFDRDGRLRELHLGELTAAGLEYKLRRLR